MSNDNNDWRRRIKKAVVWVVIFAVAFITTHTLRNWFAEEKAIRGAETTFKEIQEAAPKNYPGLSPAEAIQQEAAKRSGTKIESQSGDKQANTAADMYWGFLFVNTRSRPEFCRELGVDISPFVDAFQRMHVTETAKAQAIYARDSQITVEQLYNKLAAQFRKITEMDMEGIAKLQKLTMPETCRLFVTHGVEIANEMPFSKVQPTVYKALMAAK